MGIRTSFCILKEIRLELIGVFHSQNNDLIGISSRIPKLGELKLTSLQERRSISRKINSNSISRIDSNISPKKNLQITQENKLQLIKVDASNDSLEIDEEDQLQVYSLFTKIVIGTLERLGGDAQMQLASIDECKRIILSRNVKKNKSQIPLMQNSKLQKAMVNSLDEKIDEKYEIITAEIQNEYNDILLS